MKKLLPGYDSPEQCLDLLVRRFNDPRKRFIVSTVKCLACSSIAESCAATKA